MAGQHGGGISLGQRIERAAPCHGKAWRIAAEFLRLDAGIQIVDGAELTPALRRVLTDELERARLAAAGERLLALHQGGTARVEAALEEWLA